MTDNAWLQLAIYLAILVAAAKPLGEFMARVFSGERTFLSPALALVERFLYRLIGTREDSEMSWKGYAFAMISFPGRSVIFAIFLATMMVPLQTIIIPVFVIIRYLGLSLGSMSTAKSRQPSIACCPSPTASPPTA